MTLRAPSTLLFSRISLATLLVLGGALGCRKPKTKVDKLKGISATELLHESEIALKQGKYEDGRKLLRYIEENLPSSPEFPKAKLMLGDSYFFATGASYPEALVEYTSFINFFPRHEQRDYALYHVALCHYATIETAERDQAETRKALDTFKQLLQEAPGSPYALDAKAKVTQCWRRLAESELLVGIFYVKTFHFIGAEKRLKDLMETYPEYVDRERAYFYLGEAMRQKEVPPDVFVQFQKDYLAKAQKDEVTALSKAERTQFNDAVIKLHDEEIAKYREEARNFFQKLVESYPNSAWAGRAKDRLIEMGHTNVKEELDS